MELFAAFVRNYGLKALGADAMIKSLANWFGRLFTPRGDNFKSLLMADLGLKR